MSNNMIIWGGVILLAILLYNYNSSGEANLARLANGNLQ